MEQQIKVPFINGTIVGKLIDDHYYEFETAFLDDINDSFTFYYDLDESRFDDDDYLEYEFICRGLNLAKYRDPLNKFLIRFDAEISEENSMVSCKIPLNEESLASYCQALIFCFTYLSLLVLPENIRNMYFKPTEEKQ